MKNVFLNFVLFLFCCSPAVAQLSPNCTAKSIHPIMETHTIPPYPPRAVALAESGTTLMAGVIGGDGTPTKVTIIGTSGFDDLDQAAVDWITKTWRWSAPPSECTSVETRFSVKWDVIDVGRRFTSVFRIAAPKGDHSFGVGSTTMNVLLSDTAEILNVQIVNSSGDRKLDSTAPDILKLHKFQPALVDGHFATSAVLIQVDWP